MDGIEVAYYLIHSMEGAAGGAFPEQELRGAERFADAAQAAGVRRIVYLGGLVPRDGPASRHLASRLAVEEALLAAAPESIALRASIVIGARSRSFRFLVRLIERLPVLALPAWRHNRTRPIDGRDVLAYLAASATAPAALAGRSWDIAGPDTVTYEQLIDRIAESMLVGRPKLGLGFTLTPVASQVAAAVAGEDPALIEPLMEGLEHDLLPARRRGRRRVRNTVALVRRRGGARAARLGDDRGGCRQMTLVTASIDIDAPREKVFETMLDPTRLDEWVTIHRKVNDADGGSPHEGYAMEQTLCLRGVNFKVKWKLTEFEPGRSATWEGRGPAHSYARTAYKLSDRDGGTHFEYENEFKAAGRLPRQGGLARPRRRPAPERGDRVAQAAQEAAGGLSARPARNAGRRVHCSTFGYRADVLGVRDRLAQRLDEQPGALERARVARSAGDGGR